MQSIDNHQSFYPRTVGADQHVHNTPADSDNPSPGATTGTVAVIDDHHVSGAITNERHCIVEQIGDDEFTHLSVRNIVPVVIDNLNAIRRFEHMHTGMTAVFRGDRTDFARTIAFEGFRAKYISKQVVAAIPVEVRL